MAVPPKTVEAKDLGADIQRALELMKALADLGEIAGRKKILALAGGKEPLTPRSLGAVAALFARLDMPLTPKGILRFKSDRGLVGGNAIAGPVARAYLRAVDGGEVLFRIDRTEELELRPADRACLNFLRTWSRTAGAEPMGRLKEALSLGNPPVPPDAQPLMNEYVGLSTVREVSRVTSTRNVTLSSEGLKKMVEAIEAEKAGVVAKDDKVAAAVAARADRIEKAVPKPMTATSMPTPGARPKIVPSSAPKTALPRFPK